MRSFLLTDDYIIEEISKAFVGDEKTKIDFPYRSGPKLVEFFNQMGFEDIYGQGFPTRWRYAEEKIRCIFMQGRINEFFTLSLSYKEIIKFKNDYENFEIDNVIDKIVNQVNREILKLCGKQLCIRDDSIEVIDIIKEKPLGEGAFARVYKREKNGIYFAEKCLKDEFKNNMEYVSRFKREYEIMKSLNDTNVTVKVFDFSEVEKSFMMEFAQETLKQFIEKNYDVMNDAYKEAISEEIIRDMICLHSRNVIHRDLSYNNILVINNHFKLADFGLGKNQGEIYSLQTQTEMGVGTAHFIDPVQKQNIKNASEITDMYSIGQIIDYIFSGSIVSIHHKYSGVVEKATNKNLDKRYESLEELLEEFLNIKNYNIIKSPVDDMIDMYNTGRYNMGKVYEYLIDRNAGRFVVELIIKHYNGAKVLLEQFILQYASEVEELTYKVDQYVRENKLDYSEYDNIAYMSYDMIRELDKYAIKSMENLIGIIYYCGYGYPNRFNIQRFIRDTIMTDRDIPYKCKNIFNM
ncbi:protein kinase [Clostridium bornimense]|uniref:protein kinase domain-containing protein n=1 Tax=Clostridium bornimense TaxID=1216932 RepID=UPI001C10DF5C|nr:protein kinase [Clostridium bornimense]MBU5317837.1 protein kinase [Clostridium bornimense]